MNWSLSPIQNTAAVCLLGCAVLLSACTSNKAPEAKKYQTLEEATTALNTESNKIDLYIAELGQAKTEADKKHIACEKIPQQYDLMLAIVEANQHLMTGEDQKVQAQFKQMALEQKARFTRSLWCK